MHREMARAESKQWQETKPWLAEQTVCTYHHVLQIKRRQITLKISSRRQIKKVMLPAKFRA